MFLSPQTSRNITSTDTEVVFEMTILKIVSVLSLVQIGAHGKPVVFLHPKDCGGVLVELEEQ